MAMMRMCVIWVLTVYPRSSSSWEAIINLRFWSIILIIRWSMVKIVWLIMVKCVYEITLCLSWIINHHPHHPHAHPYPHHHRHQLLLLLLHSQYKISIPEIIGLLEGTSYGFDHWTSSFFLVRKFLSSKSKDGGLPRKKANFVIRQCHTRHTRIPLTNVVAVRTLVRTGQ